MNNLVSTYKSQGWWKEAEELEEQVMERRKRVIGAEPSADKDPGLFRSMN
jgi:hypothetical protein